METLSQLLIPILIIAGLLAMAAYYVRKEWKTLFEIKELAKRRGWTLQPHPAANRAYIFKDRHGEITWEIELYRSGRSQSALTLWKTDDAAYPDGPVLIGVGLDAEYAPTAGEGESLQPNWELMLRPAGWGAMAVMNPFGLSRLGIDPTGLELQQAGSSAFQEKYSVLGKSPASIERLLTSQVERQLLNWPETRSVIDYPLVIAGPAGITIRLNNDHAAESPDLLDKLIDLGLSLAQAAA